MSEAVEIIFVFLACIGLMGLGWLLFGRAALPVWGAAAFAVVPGRGDGEDLEQAVAGLTWLRSGELWTGTVILADCGLTDAGKAAARALERRGPGIVFLPAERVGEYIRG